MRYIFYDNDVEVEVGHTMDRYHGYVNVKVAGSSDIVDGREPWPYETVVYFDASIYDKEMQDRLDSLGLQIPLRQLLEAIGVLPSNYYQKL